MVSGNPKENGSYFLPVQDFFDSPFSSKMLTKINAFVRKENKILEKTQEEYRLFIVNDGSFVKCI